MTQPGPQDRRIELEPWEVGAELLDILSRGLYADAKAALREYVQNGVDASATHITITVDGPTVVIRDNGAGMNEEVLRAARRFGMSQKSPRQMVGYRGIGIYSAFGICEELTIISRQAGMNTVGGWRFQFGEMRRVLEIDKAAEKRQGVGLANLLHQHSQLFSEPYEGDTNDHFTIVRLDGVDDEYRAQLNDRNEVNAYLVNTIPVAFPTIGNGTIVNDWLKEHVGLNPVRVSLRIANELEFDLEPPLPTGISEPEMDWIKAPDDTALAFVWFAYTLAGKQIPNPNDSASVSGFLMKLKGFTLGDRLTLKPLWPPLGGRTLYHHYTGEIHILDDAMVFPNAARDALEPSRAAQMFTKQAQEFFDRKSGQANLRRAMVQAQRLMVGLETTVSSFKLRQQNPDENVFEIYREATNHLAGLETVQKELSKHITRGRARTPVQLIEEQQKELDSIRRELGEAIKSLGATVRTTQRRAERADREATHAQPPPQESLLDYATTELREFAQGREDDRILAALESFESAVRLHAVPQAIGILDDLKATGVDLSPGVESARKELRGFIGWSPLAPVSLEEALSQLGISLETEREESLIRSIDGGLVAGLGGRGERYEMLLRSVAESIADDYSNWGLGASE